MPRSREAISIRKLLAAKDPDLVRQGLELLRAVGQRREVVGVHA